MFSIENFTADFERVRSAMRFEAPDRVPNFDVCVSRPVREALLEKTVPDGLEGELIYRQKFGYDFLYIVPGYKKPPVYSRLAQHAVDESGQERRWIDQHSNLITDWDSFRNYQDYPDPDEPLVLDELREAVKAARELPGNVGVGALLPSCPFTEINLLMGYEGFSIALYEDFELCQAIVEKFGKVGVASVQQLVLEDIDFVFFGDDMAYTESMMISPEMMIKLFFPWYRQYIQIVRDAGKLIMFHSDGNIEPIIPDFIDAGLNALNPIEPLAMNIVEMKKKYGTRLGLIGNIDVDLLSRGTPEQVGQQVVERLEKLRYGGGYMLASSNSVCDYVKPENYAAMIQANN